MVNAGSRPTITKLVVESADSGLESADSITDSAVDPVKIDLWVQAFGQNQPIICKQIGLWVWAFNYTSRRHVLMYKISG